MVRKEQCMPTVNNEPGAEEHDPDRDPIWDCDITPEIDERYGRAAEKAVQRREEVGLKFRGAQQEAYRSYVEWCEQDNDAT